MADIVYTYKIFGLIVQSDYELKHAYPINEIEAVDVLISLKNMPIEYIEETELERESEYGCIYHYDTDWACLRYVNQGTFMIENGKEINYYLQKGYHDHYVSQILLCGCMGILLAQRKAITIHGSALYLNGKGIIISGESGSGKSTLTAELLQDEAGFIADDIACIGTEGETVCVHAGYPIRKLCRDALDMYSIDSEMVTYLPDAGKEKYAISERSRYRVGSETVGAMIVILPQDVKEPYIKEITGADKLRILIDNLYKKEAYQAVGFTGDLFAKCVDFCNQVPMYELTRPKGKMTVKEQVKCLSEILNQV